MPDKKPLIDAPPVDPPAPVNPAPVNPAPVRVTVKRRQNLDAEGLRKQLMNPPELHIDQVRGTSTDLVALATALKAKNRRYDGPLLLTANRKDLTGLPMRMGQDCHLGKEPAENLQVLSRKLRYPSRDVDPQGWHRNPPRSGSAQGVVD